MAMHLCNDPGPYSPVAIVGVYTWVLVFTDRHSACVGKERMAPVATAFATIPVRVLGCHCVRVCTSVLSSFLDGEEGRISEERLALESTISATRSVC